MQLNIYAKVKDGGLYIPNRKAISDWIKLLEDGEDVVIKFVNQADYKTYRQVRLLYVCLRAIEDFTGQEVEDVKLMLKIKKGLCFTHTIEGKDYTICKSISDFSKKELARFIEWIDIWSTTTLSLPLLTHEDKNFLNSI